MVIVLPQTRHIRAHSSARRLTVVLLIAVAGAFGTVMPARAQDPAPVPALSASDSAIAARDLRWWAALRANSADSALQALGAGVVDADLSGIWRATRQSIAAFVSGCRTAGADVSRLRVTHFTSTAVVSYRVAVDQTCWNQKAPSPLSVITVYERSGDEWVPVAHSETPAAVWSK